MDLVHRFDHCAVADRVVGQRRADGVLRRHCDEQAAGQTGGKRDVERVRGTGRRSVVEQVADGVQGEGAHQYPGGEPGCAAGLAGSAAPSRTVHRSCRYAQDLGWARPLGRRGRSRRRPGIPETGRRPARRSGAVRIPPDLGARSGRRLPAGSRQTLVVPGSICGSPRGRSSMLHRGRGASGLERPPRSDAQGPLPDRPMPYEPCIDTPTSSR